MRSLVVGNNWQPNVVSSTGSPRIAMTSARKNLIILSISGSICLLVIVELLRSAYRRQSFFPLIAKTTNGSSWKGVKEVSLEITMSDGWQTELEHRNRPSILGEWLYAPQGTPPPSIRNQRPLLILVWKYGSFLERRHIRFTSSGSSDASSPWEPGCSVRDCRLSYRDRDLSRADAVIFHLHLTKGIHEIPSSRGKPGQIWIFMTDESPVHTFMYEAGNRDISIYDDMFHWSMTYRRDSDVPVPYGRTIKRENQNVDNGEPRSVKKKKLVAIMGSNCSSSKNQRWQYVRELKTLLEERLDIYGSCLDGNVTACPGHFHRDCPFLAHYKFYLAFENSNCREYITEKVFWNAYKKESVPIIMGAPRQDCQQLLPPGSFIHVEDFAASRYLADYLRYLDDNDEAYEEYHQWRERYIVINEHGYFGSRSRHYCRVCEALRYNHPPLTKYRQIGRYWNHSRDCEPYHV